MAGKVLKMNNMRKINNSAIMNKSTVTPATTNTHNRYTSDSEVFLNARFS